MGTRQPGDPASWPPREACAMLCSDPLGLSTGPIRIIDSLHRCQLIAEATASGIMGDWLTRAAFRIPRSPQFTLTIAFAGAATCLASQYLH